MPQPDIDRTNPWKPVHKSEVFDCRYFVTRSDSVRHRAGEPRPYTHIRMKYFGIAVVPIDEDGSTTLIGQYRYVLDRFTWEVPRGGGRLDHLPIESAKAELSEETGYRADHWLHLFNASASPGVTDEIAPCFVAWGLHQGEPHPDPVEQLVRRRIPFRDAVAMALSGEIGDLASIASILGINTRMGRGELPPDLMALLREEASSG